MKRLAILSALLILLLTACSAASTPNDQAVATQDAIAIANIVSATQTALAPLPTFETTSAFRLSVEYKNAAPISMQLVIGIVQLENTNLAITSTQAESFIAILNFMKDLSMNTSATQEQFDSLVEQAQSILTDEQIAAIANMKITQDTAMNLMGQQNSEIGNLPAQGDMPQGTPPAGEPGGQPSSGDAMGTPPAGGSQPGMRFLPPQLIDMLIQLMQSKTTIS